MSLPALATVAEFAAWLGIVIDDEDARAVLMLESASGLVRSAAGQTWVDDSNDITDVPADVRSITLAVAARAWANPTSQTDGGASGPFRAGGWDATAAGLVLTDDEKVILGRYRGTGVGGLFTIRTTRSEYDLPDRYLDVVGSEPIPHVPVRDVNW